ncbi:MAG TPA: matrixin family metalloprotease, partial [Burkholderiales bacterium]|nr:matrixin family metalloprotease [Burkholderiales bacterium]
MATPVHNYVPELIPNTGNALIDGLIQGGAWYYGGPTQPTILTYSFHTETSMDWTSSWQSMINQAFASWSAVANVTFTKISAPASYADTNADIAFTFLGYDPGAFAQGMFPDPVFADLIYDRDLYPKSEGDIDFFEQHYIFD